MLLYDTRSEFETFCSVFLRNGNHLRNAEVYRAIARLEQNGGRAVVATVTSIRGSSPATLGSKMLIIEGEDRAVGTVGGGCVDGQVWAEAGEVLRRGRPKNLELDLTDREDDPNHGLICGGLVTVFLEPLLTEKIYICGAGHVGKALYDFTQSLDFQSVVFDDREMFANPGRFPEAKIIVEDFETGLPKLDPKANDSIVIVTRGHRYDEACLRWALTHKVRYIGLIGSKVKISKLFQRLLDDGFAPEKLKNVRAPVGLDIGAVTVEEIALSIASELVAFRRIGASIHRGLDGQARALPASLESAIKQASAKA